MVLDGSGMVLGRTKVTRRIGYINVNNSPDFWA